MFFLVIKENTKILYYWGNWEECQSVSMLDAASRELNSGFQRCHSGPTYGKI